MDPSLWVEQKLVPTMIAHGSFGNSGQEYVEITKCKVTYKEIGDDHFSSDILLLNLELNFEHQVPQSYSLFLKVSPEDPLYRKYMQSDVGFHNEALMYTEVIPFVEEFLKKRQAILLGELFAKCYYAESGAACAGRSDIVVLEDMVQRGFTQSVERLFLDYEHCTVALRQLARYHAIFYGLKKAETSRFRAMVSKIMVQNFGAASPEDLNYFFKTVSYKAVKYLEGRQEMDQVTVDKLKVPLENAIQLFVDFLAPREPLAVLCHGDFCRNNILFSYVSGKPCDATLFDFQAVKYASPAIDLSFFMYLNTSSELRSEHWDDLFGEYHTTLIGTLAHILGCSVEELLPDYGLEAFQKEFVERGFYGYMICSFFLPQMLVNPEDQVDLRSMCQRNIRDLADAYSVLGGEVASQKLAEILKHLASKDAIRSVLAFKRQF